jgi:hypothetical protein
MSLGSMLRRYEPTMLKVRLFESQKLKQAHRRLSAQADGMELKAIEPTPELIETTIAALANGQLPDKKVTKLIATGGLPALADIPKGIQRVEQLLNLIESRGSAVLNRCLLIGYLRLVTDKSLLSDLLRNYLQRNIETLPNKWGTRVTSYELLGKPVGASLAQRLTSPDTPNPRQVLQDAGLRGVLESSGFTRLVFRHVCRSMSKGFEPHDLARFLDWTQDPKSKKWLFENDITDYTTALVTPFIKRDPIDSVKKQVLSTLIELFKDPRTKPAKWHGVDEEIQRTLKRWLTQNSFDLLLQIVNSSNDTHQWKERHAYWNTYIDGGHISEAWVALGPRAVEVAQRLITTGELKSSGEFGRLQRSEIDPLHSMILMRIGDWIVSEWTHSGKLRFYNTETNRKAPKMYERLYEASQIRLDSLAQDNVIHHNGWQDKATQIVKRRIGLTARTPSAAANRKKNGACISCGNSDADNGVNSSGKCFSCRGINFKTR